MKKEYRLTPEEKDFCRDTVMRVANQLPRSFSTATKSILELQGIELNHRYIIDCKNLLRFDIRVVKALEILAVVNNDLKRC